mmetsp:Transcript_69595/g.130976  ORF Transcript_69595/g.130976 Transcript_69595/m.130976 type:complete len:237 (+) Transcript_69595:92-802(+)
MVTANGSPSGTATTTMVTPMMKALSISSSMPCPPLDSSRYHEAMRATKVRTAAPMPTYPICSARVSSLSWRGVFTSSFSILARMLPHWLRSPTANTTIVPPPPVTSVPDSMKGSPSPWWLLSFSSDSPVSVASDTLMSELRRSTPSAGTLSPASSCTTSPTSRSVVDTSRTSPPRTTFTSTSSLMADKARNCCSLVKSLVAVTTATISTATMIATPSTQPPAPSGSCPAAVFRRSS